MQLFNKKKPFILYWNTADQQCCGNFRWTAKELSHTYTCMHSPLNCSPIQVNIFIFIPTQLLTVLFSYFFMEEKAHRISSASSPWNFIMWPCFWITNSLADGKKLLGLLKHVLKKLPFQLKNSVAVDRQNSKVPCQLLRVHGWLNVDFQHQWQHWFLWAAAAAAAAESPQSCPSLRDPRDGSPPGSPVPGILQARTLEWGAIAFSYGLLADDIKAIHTEVAW